MRTLLLRHAAAGSRRCWPRDDRDRPLTELGRRQAQVLAAVLAASSPAAILTSPYLRCRQTVEPLADRMGVVVQEVAWLGVEAAQAPGAVTAIGDHLRATAAGKGPVVLCTHGEVLAVALAAVLPPQIVDVALAHGAPPPPGDKAGWWDLTWDGGTVQCARYAPPPC